MLQLKQYQVDAFADRPFTGNPAAVVPLDDWLPDPLLQAIAEENNLSETAFFVPSAHGFRLRWFTPVTEVALCGHATLASAHVLFTHRGFDGSVITFETLSGDLRVRQRDNQLAMDFPARHPHAVKAPAPLVAALGREPEAVLAADDYVAVFRDESEILALTPDQARLRDLELRGVVVTAPGRNVDFVSRFFAPKVGVPEDPVTGSAHCALAPYWAAKLGKKELHARQLSRRGGDVHCEVRGEQVILAGSAVTIMETEIRC